VAAFDTLDVRRWLDAVRDEGRRFASPLRRSSAPCQIR
jgi:hypothetical protein